jgi:hypothetical protein
MTEEADELLRGLIRRVDGTVGPGAVGVSLVRVRGDANAIDFESSFATAQAEVRKDAERRAQLAGRADVELSQIVAVWPLPDAEWVFKIVSQKGTAERQVPTATSVLEGMRRNRKG